RASALALEELIQVTTGLAHSGPALGIRSGVPEVEQAAEARLDGEGFPPALLHGLQVLAQAGRFTKVAGDGRAAGPITRERPECLARRRDDLGGFPLSLQRGEPVQIRPWVRLALLAGEGGEALGPLAQTNRLAEPTIGRGALLFAEKGDPRSQERLAV